MRQSAKTACPFIESFADEQSLIAIRQTEEKTAHRDKALDQSRRKREIIKRVAKCRCNFIATEATVLDMLDQLLDFGFPTGLQNCVWFKKEQPIAPRILGTQRQLRAASSGCLDELRAGRFDNIERCVIGTAIGDHDF